MYEDIERDVCLISLRDDSLVDACVNLSKSKSEKEKTYGKELACFLQKPAIMNKYVEKPHAFNEKSHVIEEASKGN